MSKERKLYEAAVKKKNWKDAFWNLNALCMDEMLNALQATPKPLLDELIDQRFAFKTWLNMPRMEYAWTVAKTNTLPRVCPGDLVKTGQLGTAMSFVKKAFPPLKTLQLHVFTDSLVEDPCYSYFDELQTQAEKAFEAQGDGFNFDVRKHPTAIRYTDAHN